MLRENLGDIYKRIKDAAIACGRDPDTVRLVAVTKRVPVNVIREAIGAGAGVLGESYIQEAKQKVEALQGVKPDVLWHFIGHLQSNKAKYAVRLFELIHSVDGLQLADELNFQAKKVGKVQKILLQVNVSGEASKSGMDIREVKAIIKPMSAYPYLSVRGLMTMPPFFEDPVNVHPYFAQLRTLRDEIRAMNIPNVCMDELSMGMTNDFEVAIEEGATFVRVGTAIFGERG